MKYIKYYAIGRQPNDKKKFSVPCTTALQAVEILKMTKAVNARVWGETASGKRHLVKDLDKDTNI